MEGKKSGKIRDWQVRRVVTEGEINKETATGSLAERWV